MKPNIGGKPRKGNKYDEGESEQNFNKRGRGTAKTPVIVQELFT